MSMTSQNDKRVEVLAVQRRWRWTAAQKLAMVRETYEAGMSVSMVARQHGVNPNEVFQWRRLGRAGVLTAVSAGEAVVPATELDSARRQIRELQRLLQENARSRDSERSGRGVARTKVDCALTLVAHGRSAVPEYGALFPSDHTPAQIG